MSRYQEIQKLNNVTIIKAPDGRFGIKDSSNSIVLATKYDFIAPLIDIDGDKQAVVKSVNKNIVIISIKNTGFAEGSKIFIKKGRERFSEKAKK